MKENEKCNIFKNELFQNICEIQGDLKSSTPLLNAYVSYSSGIINSILKDKNNPNAKYLISFIDEELNSIEKFVGSELYRVDSNLRVSFFRENIGKVIRLPNILSCYRNLKDFQIAEDDFYIKIKPEISFFTAYDVSKLEGVRSSENEVLFKPKTNFKIIDLFDNVIVLSETQETFDFEIFQNDGPFSNRVSTKTLSLSDEDLI